MTQCFRFAAFLGLILTTSAALAVPTSGLVAHLSADGPITLDGGNNVLNWTDQSGNGNDAVPGVSPEWISGSINGLPAVNFSTEHLNLPNTDTALGIANSDYEIFVVGRSSSAAVQFLTGGSGAGVGHYETHLNGAAGARFIPNGFAGLADASDIGVPGQYTDGRAYIFNPRVEGNIGVMRVAGMENGDTVASAQSAVAQLLTLGIRGNASFPLFGDQAEVLIYDRALGSSERRQVEQYLANKWDAPVNVASQTQGGVAFADQVFDGGGNASHQIEHLNNGLYGNSESWLGNNAGGAGGFAGVGFDDAYSISSLAFGRDATGAFSDRDLGTYVFEYTQDEFDPNSPASINAASWVEFLTVDYPGDAPAGLEHLRSVFDFSQINNVRGVRVNLSSDTLAIDELEVFGVLTVPEPTTVVLCGALGCVGLVSGRRRRRR